MPDYSINFANTDPPKSNKEVIPDGQDEDDYSEDGTPEQKALMKAATGFDFENEKEP